ncbi:MAG TPA: hypothetical protein VMF32_10210, partial [Xanthobacteraceae bacterium]|nr:hypothetical protein [Xanthobacteraceae bacterium]
MRKITAGMAAVLLVAATLTLTVAAHAGWLPIFETAKPLPADPSISKRGILNMQLPGFSNQYAFINFFREGSMGPWVRDWSTGAQWSSAILDANGYPCTNVVNTSCPNASAVPISGTQRFGGALLIPASSDFSGPYCLQGKGSGQINLNSGLVGPTLRLERGVSCAGYRGNCPTSNVRDDRGQFVVDDETWSGWCVALVYSGPVGQLNWSVTSDDPRKTGHYIKDLAFYEQADGADFAAGKIFRAAFKRQIVALDPSAIRFMNWGPGMNASAECDFRNRATPTNEVGYSGYQSLWTPFLPYGASAGTNEIAVAGVSGTPAAMTNCEVAVFRIAHASTGGYAVNISAISSTGEVTTQTANKFSTGDIVLLQQVVLASGTSPFNYYPVCASVIDSRHFQMYRAAFPATSSCTGAKITSVSGTFIRGGVSEYYTLNVGGRGAYPLVLQGGSLNYAYYLNFTAGQYVQFCFDKNAAGVQDGNGKWIYGVWVNCQTGSVSATFSSVPLEIETALINELNAMGPAHPISMWVTTPFHGVIPTDPDYSTAADYPANMVKVILQGANGYAGLCGQCQLFVEDTNETWNGADGQANWFGWLGALSCPSAQTASGHEYRTYATLHSMLVMNDIRKSGYADKRVKYVLSGNPVEGGNAGSGNYALIVGKGLALNSCAIPRPADVPITLYDTFAIAPYFSAADTGRTLQLPKLSAQWASDVKAYGYKSSQALADIQAWVTAEQTNSFRNYNTEYIDYLEKTFSSLASLLSRYGKTVIGYEGGWNDRVEPPTIIVALSCSSGVVTVDTGNANHRYRSGQDIQISSAAPAGYNGLFTVASVSDGQHFKYDVASCPARATASGVTTDIPNAYLTAVKNSEAWAKAQVEFFNYIQSHAYMGMPGIYTEVDSTWGFAYPDTYGFVDGSP